MDNLTGKILGLYQVVAPVGEGGMAAVYKAYQPSMNRLVALKVLPKQFALDPQFVGRFKQEAQALARLQHPHILPVFDFGEAGGYTYIVMPYVDSGTLAQLMNGPRLALRQIRDIITQIGEALDYAHASGLVHRDVKPSNVLVDKRGNCLLTDFGLAKIIEGSAHFTGSGSVLGTPAYMSPEQGQGMPADRRSDIYSLGVILYEMTVGKPPFDADTPVAIIFKHVQEPLPPPRSLNPRIPSPVERVILKALAKNPADRFQTAHEMTAALQAAIPETVSSVPASPPAAESTWSARPGATKAPAPAKRSWNTPLAALALLLLCCLLSLTCAGSTGLGALFFWRTPTVTSAFTSTATSTPTETGTATSTLPPATLTSTSMLTATEQLTETLTPAPTRTPQLGPTLLSTMRVLATNTPTITPLPACNPPEFFDTLMNRCRMPDTPKPPDSSGGGGGSVPPTIPVGASPPPTIPAGTSPPPTIPATGVPNLAGK